MTEFDKDNVYWNKRKVTAHDGLLWHGDRIIPVPEADRIGELILVLRFDRNELTRFTALKPRFPRR